jgi:hypothetical protein
MTDDCPYPEPPAQLTKLSVKHALAYLGPGVIIASVTIGSGELVFASRSGAIFGYSMLWCFLYAGLFKAIQVYTAARYITLTGEHPIVAWKDLPGPRYWFPIIIALPAVTLMPIAFSAIPEILGGYLHRLFALPETGPAIALWSYREYGLNVWASCVVCLCLGLALYSSYTILERVSVLVLGTMVVCVGASIAVFGPDLPEMIAGLFVPRVPDFPVWLVDSAEYGAEFRDRSPWLEVSIYLGAVGGGAYDYIGYIGMRREKRWGLAGREPVSSKDLHSAVTGDDELARKAISRARIWSRAPLLDTGASFCLVILVTLLFAVLATLVLHPEHAVPADDNLLTAQESFLTELHPELRWLYRSGVFLAFIGTLYGAFEVYQFTFVESITAFVPRWSAAEPARRLRRTVVAYCFCGGLLMIWLPESLAGNIVERMTFGSIISGATACGLWCFAMLWVDAKRLPGPLRMSFSMRTLTAVAGTVMTALGVTSIVAYLSS